MYNKKFHDFCSEFYSVEKTLEVVVSRAGIPTTVKIEALKDEADGSYSIRAYKKENVTVQPTYPQENGEFVRKPDDFYVFVDWVDFPWVDADSAELALSQALGFLRERCDQPARV